MSDIYRIYGPDAINRDDVAGYLKIDRLGEYSLVQRFDTQFHLCDERQVISERMVHGFLEACGLKSDESLVIMYDMDFLRMQRAQKQREYRARRKALRKQKEQERKKESFTEIMGRFRSMLFYPGADNTSSEDLYQAALAAEAEGHHSISAYIRQQGERLERQEIDAETAVRNTVMATGTEYERGGERSENLMVAEPDVSEISERKGEIDL